ncbi:MAG TPA: heme lyase CcmF/NrfE family subunit [Terriglobales bacterium]|jgi:cytochrome c-type biogenesis protein CcmF|nr:heme lyase CcmF/NrfE family subunit [Terriglobales bacterium]
MSQFSSVALPQVGSFVLLLALALGAYSFLAGAFALFLGGKEGEYLGETARRAGIATFAAVFLAAVALVTAAFTDDFSIAYIFHHSNRDLPGPYKFAVLWSGQEGSLLFWSLLLATYGFVLRLRYKTDPRLFAYASVVIAAVQVFFLMLLNFAAHPFAILQGQLPPDGSGLNPLLQYPEMVIHPPMLYLGYVGFTVPFAFALGALIMRYPGEKWIHITRRWTMVTWGFLTIGIFLGAHWAYAVLGWGGYWGWDPVENASLMPWLTGTAFLHSVMMQEKRGMLKTWNMWLIFATFWLAILGTFLTRSGIISSVHAFAQSSIGAWFFWFLIVSLATFVFFYVQNKSHLRSEHKLESMISRESSFLFNNLLFVIACFTVLWGTWFPKISELVQGNKVTVGAPFYNNVAVPVALLLLLLTAVGPLLAWRRTSLESLRRNFMWPALGGLAVGILMMILGVRPWKDVAYFYSLMAAMLATLVMLTVISEFIRGGRVISRHTGFSLPGSMLHLWHRNTRRYGGYIVHFGVAVVIIGILGTPFNRDVEKEMGFGDKMNLGPYTLVCQSYTQDDNANYSNEWAIINVFKGDQQITTLYPERRLYKASSQPQTIPRIYPTYAQDLFLVSDLYIVYEGRNDTTGQPIIKAHLNPLVPWIWTGLIVMIFGTITCLIPNTAPLRATVPARVQTAPVVGAGD